MRHLFTRRAALTLAATGLLAASGWAHAAEDDPNAMIQRLSTEVLDLIRADKALQGGDIARIMSVVDSKIMPNVNFVRMTASATGPAWRKASAEQRQQLQDEFKTLLVRTYAGALKEVGDKTVEMRPLRGNATDKEVVVRTLVRGGSEPIQLDYRMERAQGGGWKIYDLNVLGVWLVDNYRPQFAQQINSGGVDALINTLAERNRGNATAN